MKKNILITGGAGFIGSRVAFELIEQGYKVIILDNLSTGSKKFINKKSLFIKEDLKNYNNIKKKLLKFKNKIDTIFHFAASLSVEESGVDPLKYYNNNVLATENILKIASILMIKKFIFSSTCAVYGNIGKTKISEKDNTIPLSNYGKTKLLAEILIKNYSRNFKFRYAVLRYFNVVGADKKLRSGQKDGKTLFKTISNNIINKNYKITLHGNDYSTKDGSCIRDYIDVNDLSSLHILSMKRLNKKKSFILNCGYNKGYSVKEVILFFSKYINKKIKILIKKRRIGDVNSIYCDNTRLKSFFPKWKRKSKIEDSIKNSILWEQKLNNKKINN